MMDFLRSIIQWDSVDFGRDVTLQLAAVFLASTVIAGLSGRLKYLPKVSAYLMVGLVFRELGFLDSEAVMSMEVMKDIALSVILFLVDTEFRLNSLMSGIRRSVTQSKWDVILTFSFVASATMLTAWLSGMKHALVMGLLLGALAIETGPVSTLAVLREHNSSGVYTNYLKLTVANTNTAALVMFAVLIAFLLPGTEGDIAHSVAKSAWWLLLPLPAGVIMGLFLAWIETFESKPPLRLLIVLGVVLAAIGICKMLAMSQLLTLIVMGLTYANASTRGLPMLETVRLIETPLYVMFFTYSGAKLRIDMLPYIGAIGIAYVVARTAGKIIGTSIGAKRAGYSSEHRILLGMSVLSHAAVVLALLKAVKLRAGETSDIYLALETLILGSVVVFEISGPILVKIALLRSGEVSIVNAVKHKSNLTEGFQIVAIIRTFLGHLGVQQRQRVKNLAALVIKDSRAMSASADFDKLTRFIEQFPYDSFPIVDKDGFYLGFVSFNEIKDASYDPVIKDIVRATDLMTNIRPVDLDKDDIESAYEHIRNLTTTSLPVIRHDERGRVRLLGTILQRDLVAAHVAAMAHNTTRSPSIIPDVPLNHSDNTQGADSK